MRLTFFILAVLLAAAPALAQVNRAFIVGVGDYAELTDLNKTIGDANGYAEVFSGDLNFEVTQLTNPSLEDFLSSLGAFTASIQPGDRVAFVFSGHGWSDGVQNYLALSDAPEQTTEFTLKRMTVALQRDILDELQSKNPAVVLAIIDACRDNPFDLGTKSVTKGMVPQQTVPGSLVVYAAGARQKALDRIGPDDPSRYSVFTRNLLPKLRDPTTPLMRIVDQTRSETESLAARIAHVQRPAMYSDVSLDFCFADVCSTQRQNPSPIYANTEATALSIAISKNTADAFIDFRDKYPNTTNINFVERQIAELSPAGPGRPVVLVNPVYPPSAKGRGLEGTCEVLFDISTNGRAHNITANCTDPIFVDSTVRAMERSVWKLTVVDGKGVARAGLSYPVAYELP